MKCEIESNTRNKQSSTGIWRKWAALTPTTLLVIIQRLKITQSGRAIFATARGGIWWNQVACPSNGLLYFLKKDIRFEKGASSLSFYAAWEKNNCNLSPPHLNESDSLRWHRMSIRDIMPYILLDIQCYGQLPQLRVAVRSWYRERVGLSEEAEYIDKCYSVAVRR